LCAGGSDERGDGISENKKSAVFQKLTNNSKISKASKVLLLEHTGEGGEVAGAGYFAFLLCCVRGLAAVSGGMPSFIAQGCCLACAGGLQVLLSIR